ncbi:MAG: radical SAM family heme chaperone HemW [Planctomycetota bacterium]
MQPRLQAISASARARHLTDFHPADADTPVNDPRPRGPEVRAEALYLHLPFCFHKCHYCDFYSVVERGGTDHQDAFTEALVAELTAWADRVTLRPTTVFAGGGTPTFLRPELWDRLLAALHGLGVMRGVAEFTVEANPETVTPELMRRLADGGVNRVSIGAQSFQRESLAALERWHDPDNVGRAVDACRDAGIDNLSLDLIFAVPGQTLAMLDDDLDRLVELGPTHLSTYGLTYEPHTALTARLRVGKVTPIDEDTQRAMYARVLERLADADFEQYEVSNWARGSESRCVHNLAYWQNRDWLGVGPAAASHLAGHRWRNAPNLAAYLAHAPDPPIEDHEQLSARDAVGERLMLGLRLAEGLDLDWIETHVEPDAPRREAVAELIEIGMLERTASRLRLTRRGLFVADSVIAKLL